jgi:hypothetical protein
MADIPCTLGELQRQSYEDSPSGSGVPAKRVTLTNPEDINGGIPEYDLIEATYPDGVTEVYTYKLAAAVVLTVTVVYTDTTKDNISTVTKV